jgi:uncharacterized SAM-binding protein YcdF (DUF218 family)
MRARLHVETLHTQYLAPNGISLRHELQSRYASGMTPASIPYTSRVRPARREGLGRAARAGALGLGGAMLFRDLELQAAFSYHGSKVLLVLLLALAAALLGLTRLRVLVPVAFAAVAALWLAVALTPLSSLLAGGLVRRDPPAAGDAVFVLASNVQDDGDLGSAATARLAHGIGLQRAGRAPRLVVSDIADRPSHARSVARVIAGLGLDIELHAVGPAATTRDEALLAARLFSRNGWRRVVLVTSPLHSRRAAATFEAQGLEVVSSPCPETQFDLEGLDAPDDRVRAFGPALHERIGLVVYRLRDWI